MSQYQNFTSLPPEQEATMVVFEERIASASKSGLVAGAIAGLGIGLLIVILSLTVKPKPAGDYSADPGAKTQKAPTSPTAVKADTAPAETPPAETPPAEAPPATDTAPAEAPK